MAAGTARDAHGTKTEPQGGCLPARRYVWYTWFAAGVCPLMAAGLAWIFWSDPPWMVSYPLLGTGTAVLLCGGLVVGVSFLLVARACSYRVDAPVVVPTEGGVRVVAGWRPDAFLASVIARAGTALAVAGTVLIMASEPPDLEEEGVSRVVTGLGAVASLLLLGWAGAFWWMRARRRAYPGHIDMTARGISQRVGDRLLEASWAEITAEAGLSHRMDFVVSTPLGAQMIHGEVARQDGRGDTWRQWRVRSRRVADRRVWQGRKEWPEERLQMLRLLVSPVCVATNLEVVVNRASLDPGWIAWLMSCPDRAERVQAVLAAPDPFLEVLGAPAPPGTLRYSFIDSDNRLG